MNNRNIDMAVDDRVIKSKWGHHMLEQLLMDREGKFKMLELCTNKSITIIIKLLFDTTRFLQ